ncbi:phosphoenolpyruvate--protein phosphotransferase [Lysinibacillus agricola]|uniref:Phosphoenolpyruvate-protein phosphotransferase n=1 Tax=Lysinibacillus agricola TaxID=2590012 RepID=A0ABX7ANG2_9BACI|nr:MULTISPECIES: phosphoenolpyruvate--protein phosphotransferase [Lysinibacillus]KOS60971.1 phosphoenolpyruvate-protein phosphotransferase [Lysinibacillus sp. FJAT-14222]QQP11476.1 phosphoenolpyruvate--protein phosphotransferase [Lysinibacillus agricola]
MLEIQGIAVSEGIAFANAYCLKEPDLSFEAVKVTDVHAELERFKAAIVKTKVELQEIYEIAQEKFGAEKAAIFAAHLLVLEDPEMLAAIEAKIQTGMNAEFALDEVSTMFIAMFEGLDNVYMQERVADIRDVSTRVLAHLLGVEMVDMNRLTSDVIIIAKDLTPSMTAMLDTKYVKGFITDIGGKTSHSAILARTLEIPAVVGTKHATQDIQHGAPIILDGTNGKIIVNATSEVSSFYRQQQHLHNEEHEELLQYRSLPSLSADGFSIEIAGNIGKPEDVDMVTNAGGDGIGLFRTEFLYMGRQELPTEEEQYQAYKSVLEKMQGKPTIVRTLDIGGDKQLPYLKLATEMNPFLGYRAIRISLTQQEIFRVQLRALLRASAYGHLKIMFPMIATLDEFKMAKAILLEEKQNLESDGYPVSETLDVGMMIEIPSAAIIADIFAKEVDFFSIGTNDLIQYTLAADRMNENVSYLYQPYHPAVLRLIKNVIDAAKHHGKWVGMCGEMAADEIALPILLGFGLNEFSMSASSILKTRAHIAKLSKQQLMPHNERILLLSTASEVEEYVKNNLLSLS